LVVLNPINLADAVANLNFKDSRPDLQALFYTTHGSCLYWRIEKRRPDDPLFSIRVVLSA